RITPGDHATCATRRDGKLRCWGRSVGTASDMDSADEHEPPALKQPEVAVLSAGGCALPAVKPPALPSFPGVAFTEVRGYALNRGGDGLCDGPVDAAVLRGTSAGGDGRCSSREEPGVALAPDKVGELLAAVNDRSSFRPGAARCFEPHHGFVFYDG